jgi:mono/diheme cytochrome c family protein
VRLFILGIVAGVIGIAAAVYIYFDKGFAPVATSAQAMPFEKMLAKKALHARVEKEIPKEVPLSWSEDNLVAGARVYKDNCAVCHGVTTGEQSYIALGMFPKPPKLLQGTGVTDDPPQETYWKVANGIRMTGMPGFRNMLSDTEMWQLSVMLANANKLPKAAQDALVSNGVSTAIAGARSK